MAIVLSVSDGTVNVATTKAGKTFWQGRLRYRVTQDGKPGKWNNKAFTLKELDGKEIPFPTDAKPNQGRATAERALRKRREEFIKELERELDTPAGMDSPLSGYADMEIPEYVAVVIDRLEDGSWQKEGRKLAPGTINQYREHQRKHITHYFSGLKVRELTHQHINDMKADMVRRENEGEPMSAYLQRKVYMLLQEAYRIAMLNDVIDKNPFDKTTAPQQPKGKPHPLDEKSFITTCSTLNEMPLNAFTMATRLALEAGLRAGETCGLQWRHVDFREKELDIKQQIKETDERGWGPGEPKTPKSARRIPLSADLYAALNDWHSQTRWDREFHGLTLTDDDYVTGTAEGFMNPQELSRKYMNFAEAYGMKDTNGKRAVYHGLRDTFATELIRSGADVKAVSVLLGHESVQMTLDRYADALPKAKRAAIDNASLWKPETGTDCDVDFINRFTPRVPASEE